MNGIKSSISEKCFRIVNTVVMALFGIICLYPLYYVLVCSLSDPSEIMGVRGFILTPRGLNFDAYKAVFSNPNILSGYKVTMIVVVAATSLSLVLTSIGAFLMTRKDFAIHGLLCYMIIFTMYFSGGLIPTYLLVDKGLGLGDTLWALILPTSISVYNMLIMKANFESIPKELEESVKIDGGNDIIVLFRIIVPLSLPVMAVMVLFYGVANWNSWFNAMIYMRTRSKYPLQLILREILLMNNIGTMNQDAASDKYMIAATIKYATIIVATVPILLIYPFIQRYFVKGMMIGAVKG